MSFEQIYEIASSAMNAQTKRLNTVASNIANAETPAPSEETSYKALKPVFTAMLERASDGTSAGYSVAVQSVVESEVPAQVRYQPYHPLADNNGNVFYPNVNVIEEQADMMSASRSFETNVEVLNNARQMQQQLLSLGK